jgi:PTS system mannose-specific IID component
MEITIFQLVIITMLAFIAIVDGVGTKVFLGALALINSAIIGVIFGNIPVAVMTGASIQIMFIAAIPIGGASPPDQTSAGIVGATIAELLYNGKPLVTYYTQTVLTLVIPFAVVVSVLGIQLEILARTANIYWVHRVERIIDKGETKGIGTSHLLGFVPWGLSRAVLCPLAIILGTPALGIIQGLTTTNILSGLLVAGSVLPAVGLAIILSILPFGRMRKFFVLGYAICWLMIVLSGAVASSTSLSLILGALNPVLVATGVGFIAAYIMVRGKYPREVQEKGIEGQTIEFKNITQKDLSSTFRRYFITFEASWNYERMQGLGYLYSMLPILKKTHKDKEDLRNAMKMHLEFFNTNPFIAPWIIGMNAKLEDDHAPPETVRSIKVGYMGPLAGIGDSIIYFVVGGIAILIGSSIAFNINDLGDPIGALVIWGTIVPVGIILRYWFWRIGLKRGVSAAKQMTQSKGLRRIMELTGATGVTTIGAFIPMAVQVGLPVQALHLVDPMLTIVNAISLAVVPLILTFIAYFLAKRGYSVVKIILILFVIGLVTGVIGLLARPIYSGFATPVPT